MENVVLNRLKFGKHPSGKYRAKPEMEGVETRRGGPKSKDMVKV